MGRDLKHLKLKNECTPEKYIKILLPSKVCSGRSMTQEPLIAAVVASWLPLHGYMGNNEIRLRECMQRRIGLMNVETFFNLNTKEKKTCRQGRGIRAFSFFPFVLGYL